VEARPTWPRKENDMDKRHLALALCLAAAGPAFAQAHDGTARIDARRAEQQHRIQQGVASGQLTRRETRKLERQQRRIARDEVRAKKDGVVTPRERAHLTREQDAASRSIARQKHDRQRT
jgi:hypothetical protein